MITVMMFMSGVVSVFSTPYMEQDDFENLMKCPCRIRHESNSVIPADSLDRDIKSLYLSITTTSGHEVNHSTEVLKWVAFVESFLVALDESFENLKRLNNELSGKSVLLGNGLKPFKVDFIIFSIVHPSCLLDTNKEKLPHVLRKVDSFNRWILRWII
ncbi:hypothetical protein KIW84_053065 [Lathyrus oleraceus]|uniref:Uncharacterized protein n=1 Tax=Pisum sativum TaxID=3888 RepID=A0A9D5AG46_PEA|nr:hypothetical protein KIW84_053065 [Pisum sativum]